MQYFILWPLAAFFTWVILSMIMFVFSMGQFSCLEGAAYRKQYWKWSILLSIYITIPVIGWLIGMMHVSYAWNKSAPKTKPIEVKNKEDNKE